MLRVLIIPEGASPTDRAYPEPVPGAEPRYETWQDLADLAGSVDLVLNEGDPQLVENGRPLGSGQGVATILTPDELAEQAAAQKAADEAAAAEKARADEAAAVEAQAVKDRKQAKAPLQSALAALKTERALIPDDGGTAQQKRDRLIYDALIALLTRAKAD